MRSPNLLLALFLLLAGCAPEHSQSGASDGHVTEALQIVATTGMVADVVRNVAGEHAEVVVLIKPGVDPHLYKPTRSDAERILNADMIFCNGLLLEGKLRDTLDRAATSGKPVYAITELLDHGMLLEAEDSPGLYDPHVWMDPIAWTRTIEVVRDRLSNAAPSASEAFAANALRYGAELESLHAYAVEVLSSVAEADRILVTAHDAFGYFGRRYGFRVVGIQGISTESEAGLKDIEDLVELIVSNNVAAVFLESTVPERNIRALITGASARGRSVVIGGELFSDAMGPENTYEGTYIGMIDHNVTTIARALGGEAPPRGMHAKLGSAPRSTE